MSITALCIVHLFFSWSHGLKIYQGSFSAPVKLFFHRTAHFGPPVGTYNQSGPLQVAYQEVRPHLSGCDIEEHLNDLNPNTSDVDPEYDQIYNGSIVMVLRGNCTFSQKVNNAQLLGAKGVIVGDMNGTVNEWIEMNKKHDDLTITIPAVFVPHSTYKWILKLYQSAKSRNQTLYAILDADGEYIVPTSTIWLIAFGIVIVVIPTLWCFIVCMALLRKRIINYVASSRRRAHLTQIPVILYKGKGLGIAPLPGSCQSGKCSSKCHSKESPITLSISNGHSAGNVKSAKCVKSVKSVKSSKVCIGKKPEDLNAKLVDDDQCDSMAGGAAADCVQADLDMISSTMVGSLGHNLKAATMYLFKPFQREKAQSAPHNESCAICLDDFKVDEELRLLPCKHAFHKACVDPWLAKSSELCPMCKQSIFMDQEKADRSCTLGSMCYWCCISNNEEDADGNGGDGNEQEQPRIMILASPDELVAIDTDSDTNEEGVVGQE